MLTLNIGEEAIITAQKICSPVYCGEYCTGYYTIKDDDNIKK